MELYLRWLDRYERRQGEEQPVGLILCGEKNQEQIELLQLDRDEIRVAEYLVELPPKGLLEAKLHEAIRLAARAGGGERRIVLKTSREITSSREGAKPRRVRWSLIYKYMV
jgi:hypothetical protein